MKKQVSLVIIFVLLVAVFTSCAPTQQDKDTIGILDYWGIAPPTPVNIAAANISDLTYDIGEEYDIAVKDMILVDGLYKVQSRFYDTNEWGYFLKKSSHPLVDSAYVCYNTTTGRCSKSTWGCTGFDRVARDTVSRQ